ncbi:MAG: hypothetical protein IKU00_00620 [Bacteroidales bacterium]|nr:hypothetical protein [Bacteroidales bacterium]
MKKLNQYIALAFLLMIASLSLAQQPDTLCLKSIDSLTLVNQDLEGQVKKLEQQVERLQEKQQFYEEKESFYKVEMMRDLRETNEKLLDEKERYQHLSDSLRNSLIEAEKTIIRSNEELKYTQQRAKDAEAKISAATSKKKKVSAIQGIAMKTFRTPNWSLAPDKIVEQDGTQRTFYRIVNKNGGEVEFDYTAGAYVMLWDLTRKTKLVETDSIGKKIIEIKKFDQDFSYSLGLYVGFGGSNLFKNFYVGPSFKFLDFFHLSAGFNVCEYEMLTGAYQEGDELPAGFSLTDQISKVWKAKPFVSLSFDLDFISYIKK